MYVLLSILTILGAVIFIVCLIGGIITLGEVDRKFSVIYCSMGIIGLILFVASLSQFIKTETIGVYNEYEYDIQAVMNDLPKSDKIYYDTDESGITYVKVEKYIYPVERQYRITVYNYIFAEQIISKYKKGSDTMTKTDTEINIDCIPAIIYIPPETVQLKIECVLMDEDNFSTYRASQVMKMKELKQAIIDGDEWEAENIKYVLNPNYEEKETT